MLTIQVTEIYLFFVDCWRMFCFVFTFAIWINYSEKKPIYTFFGEIIRSGPLSSSNASGTVKTLTIIPYVVQRYNSTNVGDAS